MRFRSPNPIWFAAAVLICHFHCMAAEADEVLLMALQCSSESTAVPVENNSSSCAHESSCICHGTIVDAPVVLADLAMPTWELTIDLTTIAVVNDAALSKSDLEWLRHREVDEPPLLDGCCAREFLRYCSRLTLSRC